MMNHDHQPQKMTKAVMNMKQQKQQPQQQENEGVEQEHQTTSSKT
jgi:hypothetical protein